MQIPVYYIGQIQTVIFLFFILAAYYAAKYIYPLPKLFFIFIAACGLTSVAYTYGTIGNDRASVLVSILKEDTTGGLSRKLRLEIEKASKLVGGESIRQIFNTSPNESVINAVSKKDTLFIVSGTERWLSLTFDKEIQYASLPVPLKGPYPNLSKLSIVTEITDLGIPLKPFSSTAKFIGYLSAHDEIGWSLAGQMQGLWSTRSHLAYPWFRLGTEYMKRIFYSESGYETGYVDCAYNSFKQALRFASPLETRYLRMAISNNLGVLMYVQSFYEQSPQYRQKARKNIKWAKYGFPRKRIKGIKYVGNIARKNLVILNKIENRKVKRANGKRRDHKRSPK